MAAVKIGDTWVGDGMPCYVLAEIGINHNGSVETARRLIEVSAAAGCQAVKFQKRTVDVVYTQAELERPRESPFGETNGDLKRGLEFGEAQFAAVDQSCRHHGLAWLASCWDEQSVEFIERFNPPAYKIASASLTDESLLRTTRGTGKPIILSTGMSSLEQVDRAIEVLGTENLIVLHCTSTYPCDNRELNLRCIDTLRRRYQVPIGYSGHERGIATTVAAATLGACLVERHITLDRTMWGSDQASSIEPQGFTRLVRDIRAIEESLGDGVKRVYDSEVPCREKLRRVDSQPEVTPARKVA